MQENLAQRATPVPYQHEQNDGTPQNIRVDLAVPEEKVSRGTQPEMAFLTNCLGIPVRPSFPSSHLNRYSASEVCIGECYSSSTDSAGNRCVS